MRSIKYLLQIIKGSTQRDVLQSTKLSGEILFNVVNNMLDTAKVKADKIKLSYTAADFGGVLQKVLMINSKNLIQNQLFVRRSIDKSLPKLLWIDSFRII